MAGGPGAIEAGRGAVAAVVGGAVSVHAGHPDPVLVLQVGVREVVVAPTIVRGLAATLRG